MSQTPVTLTRLCRPSRTVLKQLNDECIDEILATVLKRLCVIVLHGLPTFIGYHPGVVGTYVNLPTYQITHELALSFTPLLRAVGVKNKLDEENYISSLQKIKERVREQPLDEQNLQVATHLAKLLGETIESTKTNRQWEVIYLPDSRGLMRPVSDLCVRDCIWLPDEEGVNFVNDKIPWPISWKLGVKTRKQEALRTHVSGIPFGQREKLANRLKRILTGYPCEKEILKELLQNADDAQATEVWFIKDPRHYQDEKFFEDIWKPLQGPALCVYNNKPFRKKTLREYAT